MGPFEVETDELRQTAIAAEVAVEATLLSVASATGAVGNDELASAIHEFAAQGDEMCARQHEHVDAIPIGLRASARLYETADRGPAETAHHVRATTAI